jgi:hypothetical protein
LANSTPDTMGAFRLEIQGIVAGRPLLVIDHVTRIVNDIAPEWPMPRGDGAHGVILTGRPTLTVTFEPEDDAGSAAGGGNTTAAARIVNAIPFVCAAPPGMLDALQVPLSIGPRPGKGSRFEGRDMTDRPPADDTAVLGFDPDRLRAKYREERDKRLRADGTTSIAR